MGGDHSKTGERLENVAYVRRESSAKRPFLKSITSTAADGWKYQISTHCPGIRLDCAIKYTGRFGEVSGRIVFTTSVVETSTVGTDFHFNVYCKT
ncbi:hypothetical protein NPIL_496961 [Nephila pilipes]|uniref:Uncharacterized protein n=1 Tax=Nephila pilipes TaxID=299642 RepID=A0A8X6U529_NEPPI|nr:hypothetical protein NPIL_496961 [Nephila pilipes]